MNSVLDYPQDAQNEDSFHLGEDKQSPISEEQSFLGADDMKNNDSEEQSQENN